MSASQKLAVLFTGLICIGTIGYFFQQAQSARPATPLTIAPQASDDPGGQIGTSTAPHQREASGSSRSTQIGLADLVAQFADRYEHQKVEEQQSAAAPSQHGSAESRAPKVLPEPAIAEHSAGSIAQAPSGYGSQPLPPGTPVEIDTVGTAMQSPVERISDHSAGSPSPARTLTIGGPAPHIASSSTGDSGAVNSGNTTLADAGEASDSADGLRARVADMPVLTRVEVRPEAMAQSSEALQSQGYNPPVQPDVLRTRDDRTRPAQPMFEPVTSEVPTPTVQRTYTVQPGDTFSSIAVTLYGSEKRYLAIVNANPDADPRRLRAGQVIRLPDDTTRTDRSSRNDRTRRTVGNVRHHIVGPGDNLSGIASDYYDDASKWRAIYKANRDAIGTNPNRLKSGMKLTIPALD